MRKIFLVLNVCFLFAGCHLNSTAVIEPRASAEPLQVNLVPKPVRVELLPGSFRIEPDMVVYVQSSDGADLETAQLLAERLNSSTGFRVTEIRSTNGEEMDGINLKRVDDDALGEEGYRLSVTKTRVVIEANGSAGLFYGTQTLRQMLPLAFESASLQFVPMEGWQIRCAVIEDVPRFEWRGMLLDCGRHFMDKEFVKRYIDLLAMHKMNRLHWHLTEDQGWRIEIKKYPKLTEIGGWRTYQDGTVYGGYYSQEDVREVVAYAKKRFVMVVPEIELPGHSVAALAAYPEYSCTGGPFEVETKWGVHKDVYCAGNEATFTFLQDILTETCELFDSPYIHIGGDECPKDRWHDCSKCQARIKAEGLKDEHELQSYFIQRIEKFLQTKNKSIIGWDEILEGGLAQNATVQSWRGMGGAIEAVNSGHDAIVSPTSHAYFDYDISTTDLRKVYTFEPVPDGIANDKVKH
ncbi:MAG: beta-N-acetylhexosaminidase, partial [Anaerohalosphaera sp.]|nr:beta-N-acetylhexosaminidase [Anaerohalosphaera sp.]